MNTEHELKPREIVEKLDQHIIGQSRAKRIVSIALRNRIRRMQLNKEMRDEVAPKNIIMIGPTGVGKTEIARRIAKLVRAPFLKVEATKYTEVGYVGRDVESMIRDLVRVAVNMVTSEMRERVEKEAQRRTESILLQKLFPEKASEENQVSSREAMRTMLKNRELEDKEIEIDVVARRSPTIEIMGGPNLEEIDMNMNMNMGKLGALFGQRKNTRVTTVAKAREIIAREEGDKLIDQDTVSEVARARVEQSGIVFIDEIDKITSGSVQRNSDVNREGVQRDILPIIEGSVVNTRYGTVDTTHILFIAAGAFHASRPSDLIPELQGRFPLRVELEPLTRTNFVEILTRPQNALVHQYCALLRTEGIELEFKKDAIEAIARIAEDINNRTDNIGARRLHTIMEILLEDVSFSAPDIGAQTIPISAQYVEDRLKDYIGDNDLSRYIL